MLVNKQINDKTKSEIEKGKLTKWHVNMLAELYNVKLTKWCLEKLTNW